MATEGMTHARCHPSHLVPRKGKGQVDYTYHKLRSYELSTFLTSVEHARKEVILTP